MKNIRMFYLKTQFLAVKFLIYLYRLVFVMSFSEGKQNKLSVFFSDRVSSHLYNSEKASETISDSNVTETNLKYVNGI